MDIQSLSMNMAQTRVQEEAAVRVQAMVLETVRDTSENLAQIMETGNVITDPARGNSLDLSV